MKAYETIGYIKCDNSDYEENYEKIAIYIRKDGKPTHAARQLNKDWWTSKLGKCHDIKHTLFSLNNAPNYNPVYGEPKVFMKRPIDSE